MSPTIAATAAIAIELRYHRAMRSASPVGTLKNGAGIYRIATCKGEKVYYVKRGAKSETAKGYTQGKEITYKDMAAATFTTTAALDWAVASLAGQVRNNRKQDAYYAKRELEAVAEAAEYRAGFSKEIAGVHYDTAVPTGVEVATEHQVWARLAPGFTAKQVKVTIPATKPGLGIEYVVTQNPQHPWNVRGDGNRCPPPTTYTTNLMLLGHYDEVREAIRRITVKLDEMSAALVARHA